MIRPLTVHLCGSDNDQKCPNPLSCDDHGCERLDPRCRGKLGSRPSWMSPDQYDPCRCDQPKGHDGEHQCKHTRAEGAGNVTCELGHAKKAMECPACSDSTDPAWWKWYKSRTQSKDVRQRVMDWLAAHDTGGTGEDGETVNMPANLRAGWP